MAAAIFDGSMLYVFGSQSTNTGVAPVQPMPSAVAMNVFAGQITSSPAPMPRQWMAMHNASVPLPTPTTFLTPRYSAKSFSNDFELTKAQLSRIPAIAASISGLIDRYWALRSTKLTFMTRLLGKSESTGGRRTGAHSGRRAKLGSAVVIVKARERLNSFKHDGSGGVPVGFRGPSPPGAVVW